MTEQFDNGRKLVKLGNKDELAINVICTIGSWLLSMGVKNLYRKAIVEPRSQA